MSCEAIQERLGELALAHALEARGGEASALCEHAAACAACGEHLRFLGALVRALDAAPVPAPAPGAIEAARLRAARALRARTQRAPVWRPVARAAGLALLALPVVAAHAFVVAEGVGPLLGHVLPSGIVAWLGATYFGSIALALGGLAALLPVVAATPHETRTEAGAEAR